MTKFEYRMRRGRSMSRLALLRSLNPPRVMINREQLLLAVLRADYYGTQNRSALLQRLEGH